VSTSLLVFLPRHRLFPSRNVYHISQRCHRTPPTPPSLLASPALHVMDDVPIASLPSVSTPSEPPGEANQHRIEASLLPATPLLGLPASHHPGHIKGTHSPSLSTPQLLPPPPIVLHSSTTASMSMTNPPPPFIIVGLNMYLFRTNPPPVNTPKDSALSPCPHDESLCGAGHAQSLAELCCPFHGRSTVDRDTLGPCHDEPS
jgi:hypothetical protein